LSIVSVVQTLLVYVLIPAAIYGVIALLTLVPKLARTPRYKPGQAWSYDPVWWTAHANTSTQAAGQHSVGVAAIAASSLDTTDDAVASSVRTARGGARGNW
jgi:hypothetical protein